MTVRELIERLAMYDSDVPVMIDDFQEGPHEIEDINVRSEDDDLDGDVVVIS